MDVVGQGALEEARSALAAGEWLVAFDRFRVLDQGSDLGAEDLRRLADAAWWSEHLDAAVDAYERAYASHLEGGDRWAAAMIAQLVWINYDLPGKGSAGIAAAWLRKAERSLEDDSECMESGHLRRIRAFMARLSNRLDEALALATEVVDLGTRLGDRDLIALGVFEQGQALVRLGDVEEGMALLDEATAAAVSGELSPFWTGVVYCGMIGACRALGDVRRATGWTDAARRWCERTSVSGFRGICTVHRAELMRLRGAWADAEAEAQKAHEETLHFQAETAAAAAYEIGEIKLRSGDLRGAEEFFRRAHELGASCQPGLALLKAAQGNLQAARSGLARALVDPSLDRLSRARLLPAVVEVALAADDDEAAVTAAGELESIARDFGGRLHQAAASTARGRIELDHGDASSATETLTAAHRAWLELEVPYEAAQTRELLGLAYRQVGDEDAAELELTAAMTIFRQLGAGPDLRRVEAQLQAHRPAAAHERIFMFTDICGSTSLVEAIGDSAWAGLIDWHDRTLRRLFSAHRGTEVDHAGDGFFVAFTDTDSAIHCAQAIQRTLQMHRDEHGFAPEVRIGLHGDTAAWTGNSYRGLGVHAAARIASTAGPGEIVASTSTTSEGTEHRVVQLKGLPEPIEILTIDWR